MSLAAGPYHEPVEVDAFIEAMDKAGVDKLIQITRGLMGFDNAYSIEGAARYPDRIRVMVRFDTAAPAWREHLSEISRHPHIVGIRMMTIAKDEAARFQGDALSPFWAAAEELGIPISLYAPERSAMVAQIAERHPGLRIIVDHVGMRVFDIFTSAPSMADWPNLLKLREHANVWIKISGLTEALVEGPPFERSRKLLRRLVDHFSPDRLIWGSNYPPVTQVCSYRQCVEFVSENDDLSGEEKAKLLGQTVSSVLGLDWT